MGELCELDIRNCNEVELLKINGGFTSYSIQSLPDLIEYDVWFTQNPPLVSVHDFPALETLITIKSDPFDLESKIEYSELPSLSYFESSFNRINELDDHLVNFEDEYKMEGIKLLGQSMGDQGLSKNLIRLCNMPLLENFNHSYLNDTLNLDLSSCPSIDFFFIPRLCDTLNLSNGVSTVQPIGFNLVLNTICVDNEQEEQEIRDASNFNFNDVEFVTGCSRNCAIISSLGKTDDFTSVNIFPNPVEDYFEIESSQSFEKIEIRNVQGQIVSSIHLDDPKKQYRVQNLRLKAGIYFVGLEMEGQTLIKKIIATK